LSRRPNLYVLAGVNGAGKSSVGGAFLSQANLPWYNPDSFARALVTEQGFTQQAANSLAWQEGMRQLDDALANLTPFAFETTLGGATVCQKIRSACETHDVRIWYCGLSSPDVHVNRVRLRVLQGGHDIPTEKILERWEKSRANVVGLLPHLAELGVFDNSTQVPPGAPVPDPKRILHVNRGALLYPDSATALASTPEWAQPIVEKALELVDAHTHSHPRQALGS